MTKRKIGRIAFDEPHKVLLLKVRSAPKGQLARWQRRLQQFVTAQLKEARHGL